MIGVLTSVVAGALISGVGSEFVNSVGSGLPWDTVGLFAKPRLAVGSPRSSSRFALLPARSEAKMRILPSNTDGFGTRKTVGVSAAATVSGCHDWSAARYDTRSDIQSGF